MDAANCNSIPKVRNKIAGALHDTSKALGIYISVPFCRAKCSYCNFASDVYGNKIMAVYVDQLVEDIRNSRDRAEEWDVHLPCAIDTVYLGGGTPSLLNCSHLRHILQEIRDTFSCSPRMEFTLECAPGQVEDELLAVLPSLGVNRVSLGVQSFIDHEAKAVGRMHACEIVLEDISRLRSVGIDNINVDLITGLPHQTAKSWRESLDEAVRSGVPHISIYMLDVDEDSRLGREMLAGGTRYGVGLVPGESLIAEMYGEACERLAIAGIAQYEISNFSRSGWESRHNLKYWTREPYIGFGLDAHSFLPTRDGFQIRVATTDDLDKYLSSSAPVTVNPVFRAEAIEEMWFLGLRLSTGILLTKIEREIGLPAMEAFQPVLHQCLDDGTLEYRGGCIRLTSRGKLFANEVFARFLGVLDSSDATYRPELVVEQGVPT